MLSSIFTFFSNTLGFSVSLSYFSSEDFYILSFQEGFSSFFFISSNFLFNLSISLQEFSSFLWAYLSSFSARSNFWLVPSAFFSSPLFSLRRVNVCLKNNQSNSRPFKSEGIFSLSTYLILEILFSIGTFLPVPPTLYRLFQWTHSATPPCHEQAPLPVAQLLDPSPQIAPTLSQLNQQ